MAEETIRSFLVSYGFDVDQGSRARAESATKAAEDRITAANAAAVKQRLAADNRAQAERIRIALAAGEQLTADDRRFVLEQERNRADAAERDRKREDTASKQRRERLESTAKQVRAFALNAASVAAGVVAAVGAATGGILGATDQAAKGFERLNYMAQNSGTSVRGLQAFGFGIAQLGGDAKAAEGELAEFGNRLKTFPQFEKNLQSMGIATRDAGGHMRDAAEIAKDYFAVLAKMPRAQQDALGEVYGFGTDTIRAGTRPGLGGHMADERAHQNQIGADPDEAGRRGAAFERSMRTLQDDIQAVKTRIETALFGLFKPALDNVSHWIEEHGKAISTTVIEIAKGISDVVKAFVDTGIVKDAMKSLSDGLEQFAKYVSSGDFKKDVKGFCTDIMALAKWVRSALEYLGILPTKVGAASVPEPTGSFSDHEFSGGGASLRNRRHHDAHDYTDNDQVQGNLNNFRHGRAAGNFGQKGWWTSERQSHAVDKLMKEGGLTEDGAKALVARWTYVESAGGPESVNPKSGAEGIAQWLGTRKGDGSRGSFDDQLSKVARELNGPEAQAKRILNTKGREAEGASAYERAEGYAKGANAGTHRDNFTDRTAAGMAHVAHGQQATPAPSPAPATSSGAPSDSDYKAAQARYDALMAPGHVMTAAEHDQLGKDNKVMDAYWASKGKAGPMPHVQEEYFGAKAGPEVKDGRNIGAKDAVAAQAHRHHMNELIVRAAHHGMLHPYLHGKALGDTEALRRSVHHSVKRESNASLTHNPTYNITAPDLKSGMEVARMSADRGNRDLVRNIQPKLA